ncbi:hypothetical protein DPMN_166433 [Dreissena polymorpha]|uniref:Uncharacterized protein n=1 Tax=Dreissena polymorpha TaxID=45954 RepID=A0A9D4F2J0_DREPO|nr:hypothetical protein DPMN_166433 [Dreissena polymorpha]
MASDVDLCEMSILPAADSVDHNTINIDDKCTFHEMGVRPKQATELKSRNKTTSWRTG